MADLAVYCDSLTVQLDTGISIVDITDNLSYLVNKSGITHGSIQACMVGSTGSITTIEYEQGVIQDLIKTINDIASPDAYYAHEEAWHDGNGHSHVQAALLGPSICIAVRDKKLALGTWQQVVAINHDNRHRTRTIEVTIIGEK